MTRISDINVHVCVVFCICFRPVTPAAQVDTPSHRLRNLPCTEITNRDYSPSASISQRAKYNKDDVKKDKGASVEVRTRGHPPTRRSLHYDNNENIIDNATTEYVFSRKRPVSPESPTNERPRKRCRTAVEPCILESFEVEPLQADGTESDRRLSRRLSTVTLGRKSNQWKVSTPTPTRTLTPRKDGTTLLDTPSKSVTFHDSVVGGDDDDVNCVQSQSPKATPRSGRRTQKMSQTPNRESPVQSGGKATPRARRSICLTPKSSQKGTPGKSSDAASSPAATTPQRSSARVASMLSQSPRRSSKKTPRTDHKKHKDLPARRLVSTSSPGTGRVLRPRTPKSYKFTAVDDHDDDLYQPDVESSDEEELLVKETPTTRREKEVHNFVKCS